MESSIKKIILATDFSDASEEATNHALQLAKTYKAELKALHVFDPSAWNLPSSYYFASDGHDEDIDKSRQQGKDALNKLAKSISVNVESIFAEGDPGHVIVRIAEEHDADLIILGSHGYTGWKRFTMGSVAELVVRHAPCAVFVVRSKRK